MYCFTHSLKYAVFRWIQIIWRLRSSVSCYKAVRVALAWYRPVTMWWRITAELKNNQLNDFRCDLLLCTCDQVHPGRVEPASPMEFASSLFGAVRVKRSLKILHNPLPIVHGRKLTGQKKFQAFLEHSCSRFSLAFSSFTRWCEQMEVSDKLGRDCHCH